MFALLVDNGPLIVDDNLLVLEVDVLAVTGLTDLTVVEVIVVDEGTVVVLLVGKGAVVVTLVVVEVVSEEVEAVVEVTTVKQQQWSPLKCMTSG